MQCHAEFDKPKDMFGCHKWFHIGCIGQKVVPDEEAWWACQECCIELDSDGIGVDGEGLEFPPEDIDEGFDAAEAKQQQKTVNQTRAMTRPRTLLMTILRINLGMLMTRAAALTIPSQTPQSTRMMSRMIQPMTRMLKMTTRQLPSLTPFPRTTRMTVIEAFVRSIAMLTEAATATQKMRIRPAQVGRKSGLVAKNVQQKKSCKRL